MSGTYRVRVNLEALFSDERARLMVVVRAARSVRWLERRVRAALGLGAERLLLVCEDHLLPPAERLAVLRPDDTVHVFRAPNHYTLDCSPRLAASSAPPAPPRHDQVDAPHEEPHRLNGESADYDALRESKARALLQLERLCGEREATPPTPPTEHTSCNEDQAPRARARRRRVRRRRTAPYPYPAGEGPGPEAGEGPGPEAGEGPGPEAGEGLGLEAGEGPRPPRLVTALEHDAKP